MPNHSHQGYGRNRSHQANLVCSFWEPKYKLEEVLGKEAEEIAKQIKGTSKSQIRNFYGEIKTLERKLKYSQKWDEVLPLIKLVKAKVKYASKRQGSREGITEEFVTFIEKSIDSINDQKKFKDFCLLFEAVVGYHYYYSEN